MDDGVTRTPLSPGSRRARNREAMVESILETAVAIMTESGVAALSLQEVARRLGMRAPSLYEYFPGGKMAVYDALFVRGIRLFLAATERAPLDRDDPWSILHASMTVYMTFAHQHPALYALCFERPVPAFVPSEAGMQESRRLLAHGYGNTERMLADGRIAPGIDAQPAADLALATIHGLTALHMANEPHLPPGEGRFGSLIPPALDLFRRAWDPSTRATTSYGEEPIE
jgi:AcrR family transcriptional regulator